MMRNPERYHEDTEQAVMSSYQPLKTSRAGGSQRGQRPRPVDLLMGVGRLGSIESRARHTVGPHSNAGNDLSTPKSCRCLKLVTLLDRRLANPYLE